jgi:peptide/nickel transport system substrate-binding protein
VWRGTVTDSDPDQDPRSDQSFHSLRDSRRGFLAALGSVGAVTVAGCSGGSSSSGDGGSGSSGSGSSAEESRIKAALPQEIGEPDPAVATDLVEQIATGNLYDALVFPTAGGDIEPHIASDWTVSDDGLTYEFTIRDDAAFHSGNQVTAEDVVFSVERFLEIGRGNSGLFADLITTDSVTQDGDDTVIFELNEPFAPFLPLATLIFVVDKQLVMNNLEDGEFGDRGDYGQAYINNNDAGSGAYELESITRGTGFTMTRNEDYFKEFREDPIDTVRLEIITSNSTVQTQFQNQELHRTSVFQSSETYNRIDEMDHARTEYLPESNILYMKINTQKQPTDDPAVREAICWGFDYQTVHNDIRPNMSPAQGPLPPTFSVHDEDVLQPSYDPERAQSVLEEAGYSEGDITLTHTYSSSYAFEERIGALFKDNMEDIGINVELQPQTWGTITELATTVEDTPHTNQVFLSATYPSPDALFFNKFHSNAVNTWQNMNHLENEEVDALIDEARRTVDAEARNEKYVELQNMIAEMYTDIYLYHVNSPIGINNRLEGLTVRPSSGYSSLYRDLHFVD